MRIESDIEYWTGEFLTFDPEKIINKLSDYFPLNIDDNTKISGYAKRYTIAFFSEITIDVEIEKIIIEFLKMLNYGEIKSDVETKHFRKPDENNKDFWLLEESI